MPSAVCRNAAIVLVRQKEHLIFESVGREAVIANRAQFMKDLAVVYYGADRAGANISEALLDSSWSQDMLTGFPAAYFAIKAFSETDTSEDLKKIDVPTLILHGDADQIVPIGNAYRTAKLIPDARLNMRAQSI